MDKERNPIHFRRGHTTQKRTTASAASGSSAPGSSGPQVGSGAGTGPASDMSLSRTMTVEETEPFLISLKSSKQQDNDSTLILKKLSPNLVGNNTDLLPNSTKTDNGNNSIVITTGDDKDKDSDTYGKSNKDDNNNNNKNGGKYDSNASLFLRYFFLVSILLQNSMFTLLRRYNKGVLYDKSSNSSILIGGEFMKIGISLFMGIGAHLRNNQSNNTVGLPNKLYIYFRKLVETSPKLMVPALIYLCMNWLSLLSLERIDASTFTVIAQCKTLSTALAGYFFLKKRFSQTRVRALIHLVCSVIVITYVANNSVAHDSENDKSDDSFMGNSSSFMMGVLFVLIEVSLSGCVSVYYEKVLKDDKNTLSVWDRNIQLASFSIIMYFYSFAKEGYFINWSIITALVSLLGALGGVLVAFSIKYTDSVLKAMSTSCAIVLTSILSAVWLDGPYNIPIAVSSISVVVAIFTYVTDGKMCEK